PRVDPDSRGTRQAGAYSEGQAPVCVAPRLAHQQPNPGLQGTPAVHDFLIIRVQHTPGAPEPLSLGSVAPIAETSLSCCHRPRQPRSIEEQMNLQKIYTTLLTEDLAEAERWYTKLLGRGPDYRPMETLVHWELFDQGGLMLSSSEEIAGNGMRVVYVQDLAAARRRLQGMGVLLGDDTPGDYSTLAQTRDPDGNLLTLATPPARPFPPACPTRRLTMACRGRRAVHDFSSSGFGARSAPVDL